MYNFILSLTTHPMKLQVERLDTDHMHMTSQKRKCALLWGKRVALQLTQMQTAIFCIIRIHALVYSGRGRLFHVYCQYQKLCSLFHTLHCLQSSNMTSVWHQCRGSIPDTQSDFLYKPFNSFLFWLILYSAFTHQNCIDYYKFNPHFIIWTAPKTGQSESYDLYAMPPRVLMQAHPQHTHNEFIVTLLKICLKVMSTLP